MSTASSDCLVVGGGLIGLSTALHLRWRGHTVRVLEKDRIGDGTSSRSSGWISAQLRTPNELLALVLESLAYFPELLGRLDGDCAFSRSGSLVAFDSEDGLTARRALDADQREVPGYAGARFLDGREVHEMEPALADRIIGGAFFAGDAQVDPRLLLGALLRTARAAGVTVHEGSSVSALTRDGGAWRATTAVGDFGAPAVVISAGAWSPEIAGHAGYDLPVLPVSGQLLVSTPLPGALNHCVVYQPDARFETHLACGIRPATDGRLWMGTTYRAGTFDTAVTGADTRSILDAVGSVFPTLAGVVVEQAWAGVRPVPADLMPIYGAVPALEGYYVAVPVAGLAESAIAGKIMAAVIAGENVHPELSPARFATEG